jgi:hypothetical protein
MNCVGDGIFRSFRKVDIELSRELGLKPWEPSVYELTVGLDDDDDGIPTGVPPGHRPHWERVRDLWSARRDRFQCAIGRNIAPYFRC